MSAPQQIEREFVGTALALAGLVDPRTLGVAEDHLHYPETRTAWAAMLDRANAGRPISKSIIGQAVDQAGIPSDLWWAVVSQAADSPTEGLLGELAARVRQASLARRLNVLLVEAADALARDETPARVAQNLTEEIALHDLIVDEDDVQWLRDFPIEDADSTDWIFDGAVARGDRIIYVGPPGSGKSVVTSQLAVCCAAGFDPHTMQIIEQRPSLIVNGENKAEYGRWIVRQLVDRLRHHVPADRRASASIPVATRFLPDGLDLRGGIDYARLERWVREVQPAVLVLGPLYGVGAEMRGRETAEQAANDFRRRINRLAATYNMAVVMEHHGTKGNEADPANSHVFMRWPDVGVAMVPLDRSIPVNEQDAFRLTPFRGHRGQRPNFPRGLRRGGAASRPGADGVRRPDALMWMPLDHVPDD